MDETDYWVHDLDPFLIRFGETIGIRYYGLAYLLGFLIAYGLLVLYFRKKRSPLNPDQLSNTLFALILGVLVGGRLGFVLLYDTAAFLQNPMILFRVWEGGMSSHGGFIGVMVAIFWTSFRERIAVLRLSDLLVTVTPPGLMLGRIANFINGELWGRVTQVPWAVIFPQSAPGVPVEEIPARHPSQLYQAGMEGLLPLIYLQLRFWRTDISRTTPGHLTGEFFLLYAIGRIVTEQFREPDAPLILGMTRGTFYSIFLLLGGIALIVYARRARRK
ncbi:MAG: prolipoprotein diacylglyceryl transferase [Opitutales bacterium]